jgi:pyoverdine/dityrosine biosynthesis protein Dit1
MPSPGPPPQDRALRSRLRILEAATALFASKGFDATTFKDVAGAAELSVGLVCRYFPTREHLALALYGRLADDLVAAAVELPEGKVARRFALLMRARIGQCEAQRRPLTALLGKALDPESALYALGAATDTTRAKVQGALQLVLAGARDAPRSESELARDAQLLYTLHLGVVLATLARPDASSANALVSQLERALGVTRLPFLRRLLGEQLDALLLDRARMRHANDERATARDILTRLFANNRVLPGVPAGLTPASEALHRPQVEAFVRAGAPLELVLPAFPAKSPNPQKVLGALPDLAEERALERLSELLDELTSVWPAGARLTICSDGHVFADAVGVRDEDVDAYRDALLGSLDDPRIGWFDLETAFGEGDPATLRARLMTTYAEPEAALHARAEQSRTLAAQLDGIHRFLYEDEIAIHPELTKSQARKRTRARAYEVVRRSEAWGALVGAVFPSALRLSIHPQPDPSTKIGVNLLGVRDPWLTPWHGVAVVGRDGTSLMHREDAERAGARVALNGGRPSHLELP